MFPSCENPSEKRACPWSATCSWLDVEGTGHEPGAKGSGGHMSHAVMWITRLQAFTIVVFKDNNAFTSCNYLVCFLVVSTKFWKFSLIPCWYFPLFPPPLPLLPFWGDSTAYGWRHGTHDLPAHRRALGLRYLAQGYLGGALKALWPLPLPPEHLTILYITYFMRYFTTLEAKCNKI